MMNTNNRLREGRVKSLPLFTLYRRPSTKKIFAEFAGRGGDKYPSYVLYANQVSQSQNLSRESDYLACVERRIR